MNADAHEDCPTLNSVSTAHMLDKLAASLERLIHRRIPGMIRDLRVEVGSNEIWLQGRCATLYLKQSAQRAVMNVMAEVGLLTLRNDIEIA